MILHRAVEILYTGYFFKKVLRWGAPLTSPDLTFRARGEVGGWYESRVTLLHRVGKGTTVSQNRQSQSPAFLIGKLAVSCVGICTDEKRTVRCLNVRKNNLFGSVYVTGGHLCWCCYLLLWQTEVLPDGSNFLGHQLDRAGLSGCSYSGTRGSSERLFCVLSHMLLHLKSWHADNTWGGDESQSPHSGWL